MAHRWDLQKGTESRRERLPAVIREPVRLALLAGALLLVAGSLLDWIEAWLPYREWFTVSGFAHAGDGAITLVIGLVLVALAMSEGAAETRIAPLVAAPLTLGVAALLLLRIALHDAQSYLDSLHQYGGHGDLLPGFWVAVAGAAATVLAGAVRVWRARHEVRFGVGLHAPAVAAVAGGVAGAGLGYLGAIEVGQSLLVGTMGGTLASVMILLAILGTFLGAWLGARVGRSIVALIAS